MENSNLLECSESNKTTEKYSAVKGKHFVIKVCSHFMQDFFVVYRTLRAPDSRLRLSKFENEWED